MLTSISLLKQYVLQAPAIRLSGIRWCLVDDDRGFLLGTPVLPLPGTTFWNRGNFFIPSGFDFNYHLFTHFLDEKINPDQENWVVWTEASSYFLIHKLVLKQLSIGSFRKTISKNPDSTE